MVWLKRNLLLLVSVLVALGLLGAGGYFLYLSWQKNQEVAAQLNDKTEELKKLMNRDPHPGNEKIDNIGAAKREQARLMEALNQDHKLLAVQGLPAQLDSAKFKSLMETTIYDLQREAESSGVGLPRDPSSGGSHYSFSFEPERTLMQFQPDNLAPLAAELLDVRAICEVLFAAKTHEIMGLRRSPVTPSDPSSAPEYLAKSFVPNDATGTVLAPYEVTFKCFSSELAGTLQGFAHNTEHFFVVKVIDVEKLPDVVEDQNAGNASPMARYGLAQPQVLTPAQQRLSDAAQRAKGEAEMRRRYHLDGARPTPGSGPRPVTPAPMMPAPGVNPAPVHAGPSIVLDEKPLKVTIMLQLIRLKAPTATVSAK